MSLAGYQIIPIDVNFYLQKSFEIFDKKSADRIWSKNDKEIKVSPLMPIRVKELIYWKKGLIKVAQQPHKPLCGSNQIWATTSEF